MFSFVDVGIFLFEVEADTVHTVSITSYGRTIVEDVPKVAFTSRAHYLGAVHTMRVIHYLFDRSRNRLVKARPSSA